MLNIVDSLSLDDIMLVPKYSTVSSRSQVDLSVNLVKGFKFNLPYVPSNMATITEIPMAKLMYDNKSMAVFHRFAPFSEQLEWLEVVKSWSDGTRYVGFSIGVKAEDYAKVDTLIGNGAEIIVIDIAHGWSEHCLKMTSYIAEKYPNVLLVSGNAADGDGAYALWSAGCDVVKAGIGGGSICTTRIQTGNGVPSASSLMDCRQQKLVLEKILNRKLFLMQDGGLAFPGQIAKALCFADLVMCGNIFSATDETPGDIVEIAKGDIIKKFKKYVGSSTHKDGKHKEGVEALKEYKGSAQNIIEQINDGATSCCSYQGVFNLEDLKKDPKFIRITSAGSKESGSHDLDIILK